MRGKLSIQQIACLLAPVLMGAFVILPTVGEQGWKSDDYALLEAALTSWSELGTDLGKAWCAVFQGERPLNYWLGTIHTRFIGGYFGQVGAHFTLGLIHILNALLAGLLFRQIGYRLATCSLAATLFVVSPWVTQGVFWWTSNVATFSSTAILAAALGFLRWRQTDQRRFLALSLGMTFLCLTVYELWIAFPILFLTIEFLRPRDEGWRSDHNSLPLSAIAIARPLIPFLVLISLWVVLSWMAWKFGSAEPRVSPSFSPIRLLIGAASVHLRCIHWFTDTPWSSAFSAGISKVFSSWWTTILAIFGTLSIYLALVNKPTTNGSSRPTGPVPYPLLKTALLAWSFFLASRLVLILQGGVATHTRHNYGAAIGFGLLVAWGVVYATPPRSHRSQRAVALLSSVVILGLGLVSLGIGTQYVETSRMENQTLIDLERAHRRQAFDHALIVGFPEYPVGEMSYYEEGDGQWLHFRTRNQYDGAWALDPEASGLLINNDHVSFVARGQEHSYPRSTVALFQWSAGELVSYSP